MKRLVAARLAMVALATVSALATISPAAAARPEPALPAVHTSQQPGTGTMPAPEPCTRITTAQASLIRPNLTVTLKSAVSGGNSTMTTVYTVTNIGCGVATEVMLLKSVMRKDPDRPSYSLELSSEAISDMARGDTKEVVITCGPKPNAKPCWGSRLSAKPSNTDSNPSNNWDSYEP